MKLKIIIMSLLTFLLFLTMSISNYAADEVYRDSIEVAKRSVNWYQMLLFFTLVSIVIALIIRFSYKQPIVGKEIIEEIP